MKLSISIDLANASWILRGAIPGAFLIFVSAAYGGVPHTFQSGDTLLASDLMADLNDLDIRVSAASKVTAPNGMQFTLGGIYRSKTASTTASFTAPGGLVGLAAAKKLCEDAVAQTTQAPAPGAHMCSAEEIQRSVQMGIDIPAGNGESVGWFSTLVRAPPEPTSVGGDALVDECLEWTVGTQGNSRALYIEKSPSGTLFVNESYCSDAMPILCCD